MARKSVQFDSSAASRSPFRQQARHRLLSRSRLLHLAASSDVPDNPRALEIFRQALMSHLGGVSDPSGGRSGSARFLVSVERTPAGIRYRLRGAVEPSRK